MLTVNNTCSSHMYIYTHMNPQTIAGWITPTMTQQLHVCWMVLEYVKLFTSWLEFCMSSYVTYMYLHTCTYNSPARTLAPILTPTHNICQSNKLVQLCIHSVHVSMWIVCLVCIYFPNQDLILSFPK